MDTINQQFAGNIMNIRGNIIECYLKDITYPENSDEYAEIQRHEFRESGNDSLFFVGNDFVWKVCSNQKLNKGLKQIAEATGITKPLFCHLARHTFATTVTLSNGISMESVSKMLGHTSLKHTQIYAKIVASKVKSEMKGLRGMFQ